MSDYYILITDAGAALEVSAHASGTTVELSEFGVCDGGVDFIPDPTQTTFANEEYRGPISSLTPSSDDSSVLVAQCVIPAESGGYTIRGVAIYASDGTLYATGNYADQDKPAPDSGFAVSLEILAQLAVSDTADVTLTVTDATYLTESEADTLYLRQDKSLSEIKENGAEAQTESRENIGCGTAATLDATTSTTDNTVGHVLKVGDRGLGMTAIDFTGIDFNTYKFAAGETLFLRMEDCTNIPDGIDTGYVVYAYVNVIGVRNLDNNVGILIGDNGGAKYYWAVRSTDSSSVTSWKVRILPQSAADVSAVPQSNSVLDVDLDTLTGSYAGRYYQSMSANATSAYHYPVQDAGSLDVIKNSANGAEGCIQEYRPFDKNTLYRRSYSAATKTWSWWDEEYSTANPQDMSAYMTSSTANGKFVTGVRFGANMSVEWGANGGTAPAGCALTGGDFNDGNSYPYYARLQYCINGTWVDAAGGVGAENLVSANHYQGVPDGTITLLTNLKPYLRESNHLPGLAGVQHYIDDNGYDWFEAAPKLAGAVFIAVAPESGVIVQIADSSLPDTDAFSLYPNGVTVAGLDSLPAGCTIDGTWKFDAESRTVSQDADLSAALALTKNTQLRAQYAANATLNIATLQAGIASDRSVDGDSNALTAWQGYLCDLRDMTTGDLQQSPATFPDAPASVF